MKHSRPAYRRHDLSDETWVSLDPHLPGRKGMWGGVAQDNRLFINAVVWIYGQARRGVTCRRSTGMEQYAPPLYLLAG